MSTIALRHRLEAAFLSGARACLRTVGPQESARVGAVLGRGWQLADRRHARATRHNLALAFPGMTAAERRRLARRTYEEFGASVFFTLSMLRLPPETFASRVDWEGWENFEDAERDGKGVALLAAHLGPFEAGAWAIGLRRPPVHVVVRRMSNAILDDELEALRRQRGIEPVERHHAIRALLRVLRAKGRIGFAMDQRVIPEQAIEVPFFGQRSFLGCGLALLSQASGAPVVPLFTRRDGERLHVRLGEPIRPRGEGPRALHELTCRHVAAIEEEIRKAPELWTWQHAIWRPGDEALHATSSVARELADMSLAAPSSEPGRAGGD